MALQRIKDSFVPNSVSVMKAIAYSIKSFEKEFMSNVNQKKHPITLISKPLNFETLTYATDKDVVIVSAADNASTEILKTLASLHVRYMISRSGDMDNIDQAAAIKYSIQLANTHKTNLTTDGFRETADQISEILDFFKVAKDDDKSKNKINFH